VSNRIPREFIDELIARTDIVELIDARVSLKKAGRNYQACCPFHVEKSPSFTVSSPKQFYHCFGCGASGNAIGFLMAHDRLEFRDALELLAKQLGLAIPVDAGKEQKSYAKDLYEPLQKSKKTKEDKTLALFYLDKTKLCEKSISTLIEQFEILLEFLNTDLNTDLSRQISHN